MNPSATTRDWLALAVLVATWGSSFAMTKVAVASIDPAWVMALRLSVAGVFLAIIVMLTQRQWPRQASLGMVRRSRPDRPCDSLLSRLLGNPVHFVRSFRRAVRSAGVSFVAYSNYLVPVYALGLGAIILGETLTANVGIGLVLILAGIAASRMRSSPLLSSRRKPGPND